MSEEVKADGFVRPGYSCADDCTAEWVHQQTRSLVGRKAETPKSGPKYFACVADVVRTIQKTPSGLIAWPMNDAHYSGAAYGRDIAQKTKAALIRQEHLVEVQRH